MTAADTGRRIGSATAAEPGAEAGGLAVLSLPALIALSIRLVWLELPRAVAVCVLWLLTLVPAAVAVVAVAPWWLVALATVPGAIGLTGVQRYAVGVQRGERPPVREALRIDPVLGVSLSALGAVAAGLVSLDGAAAPAGFAVAGAGLVVAPAALAYGAVRGRRGLAAWRGGVILVAYRPGAALTVLSLACLGGFAIAATVGALAAVVPVMVAGIASAVVRALLDTIDAGVDRMRER